MRYLFILSLLVFGCKTIQQDKRCRLKPDPGPCEAVIEKFYYDKVTKECKPFDWGGCHGVVPFDFLDECEACAEVLEGSI